MALFLKNMSMRAICFSKKMKKTYRPYDIATILTENVESGPIVSAWETGGGGGRLNSNIVVIKQPDNKYKYFVLSEKVV